MNYKKTILIISLFAVLVLFSQHIFAGTNDFVRINTTVFNQDPDPAEPGKYLDLRLKAEKTGNINANNVEFYLETEYPFTLDPSTPASKQIGNLYGGSGTDWYYTLYYKLKVDSDALEGVYTLKLKYKYNDMNFWSINKFEVRVGEKNVPKFTIGSLVTSPKKLISDTDEAELSLEIQNIGNGDAENVIVDLNLPPEFTSTYAYSNRYNLGNIPANTSKTAKIYVDIAKGIQAKEYQAILNINYKEKDDTDAEYKTTTLLLDIPIKKKPEFIIEKTEISKDLIYPGDKIDVKLYVKNVGQDDSKSVSVRIYKDSSQPFEISEKSDFIGDLKENESGVAILSLDVDTDAQPKEYKFNIEIRSISGSEVIIQDESINLLVSEKSKNSSKVLVVVLSVIVGVAIIFGAYLFGKKKSNIKKK